MRLRKTRLAGDEVTVVVTAHEAEIKVLARVERDVRFRANPGRLTEFRKEWTALPTAKQAQAEFRRRHSDPNGGGVQYRLKLSGAVIQRGARAMRGTHEPEKRTGL
jgi:hypothetical protein